MASSRGSHKINPPIPPQLILAASGAHPPVSPCHPWCSRMAALPASHVHRLDGLQGGHRERIRVVRKSTLGQVFWPKTLGEGEFRQLCAPGRIGEEVHCGQRGSHIALLHIQIGSCNAGGLRSGEKNEIDAARDHPQVDGCGGFSPG